jgi:formylglycine-generating enzyme required for sulfatase activity
METVAFIAQSRKSEVAARRRTRMLNAALYTMLVGIILGLVGWINQATIADGWRFLTVTWPYERANVRPYVLTAAQETALKPGSSFWECASDQARDYCPELIVVPTGSFMMGAPPTEKNRYENEGPQHTVTIAEPFAVARVEVTFDEWDTCVAYGDCTPGVTDSGWGRGQQPVINVTWDDAQRYAAWLSKITGKPYRLLSEAQYEYAARAGTQTRYPWGDDIGNGNANCNGCGGLWENLQPAPVDTISRGLFHANGFGLYHMVGNVLEWVEDCYHADYSGAPEDGSPRTDAADCGRRVIRGGSYNDNPVILRSASRDGIAPGDRGSNLGFRVGRTLAP